MSDPVSRLNAALEGRYAIERELGEGGMATVYLAKTAKENQYDAEAFSRPGCVGVCGLFWGYRTHWSSGTGWTYRGNGASGARW